jgi:glycerophosphoryl diester phosphodiesterase
MHRVGTDVRRCNRYGNRKPPVNQSPLRTGILPGVAAHFPYLDAPAPIAFAHRGGAGSAGGDPTTENTLEAFRRAVDLGYRYLESDVHATRDQVPVLFHDPTLDRLAGRTGAIAQLTWRDLATIRIGGAAAIPRLADALGSWPQIRFNLDIKSDQAVEPAVRVLTAAAATDRVLLASFSDARLARLRRLIGPRVPTSLGWREVARLRLASIAGLPLRLPPSVVAAQVPAGVRGIRLVDTRFVSRAHRLGLQVHVWTVNDPHQMRHLLQLGVDGIMTDRLETLRGVLRERGQWHPAPQ